MIGESVVNDATGLVVYKFAVLAVVAGSFSMLSVSISFVWVVIVGSLVGYFTTLLYLRLYPYIKDHTIEIISTFIVPYAAYLIAESFEASGVLAVVVAGLKLSWESPNIFAPESRIRTTAVWEVMTFALNGFVFIIGWTGMRGVVSLAAALALPYVTNLGTPFPERDLLIFLAFSVILGTLVLQGLSLPWVIRRVKLAMK
ncbi:MAG: cation:proton antiporter [Proteobacteria bacterium]|nr:cation:proton antiporter [Pseudomonadota bacterium]